MKDHIYKSYDFKGSAVDLLKLFCDEPYVFLLDSSLRNRQRGRYSIIGFDPFAVYQKKKTDSLDELKTTFNTFKRPNQKSLVPLCSGLVGYIGYDYGLYQEKIRLRSKDDLNLPGCLFGFYDCIITIDHFAGKLYVTSSGLPEKNKYLRQTRAQERFNKVLHRLSFYSSTNKKLTIRNNSNLPIVSNFTKQRYLDAVQKALEYIRAGDIYQVNLSQRFTFDAKKHFDSIEIYRNLRELSPSSFGAFFKSNDFEIISSSPERFLFLKDGHVHTRPMKGTRPRGETKQKDKKLREEIITSLKDKAELLMITDLERNDLGRVCEYGSVRVKEMREIEEYKTVFQATSCVKGKLRENQDGFDLLKACFPGGSITGCPKIRSMEIIEELEPTRRGIYTGSLGYMDFNGNMDFNILIRTLLAKDKKLYFQVGGGIVSDSTPENEYNETLIKAKAMRVALESLNTSEYRQSPVVVNQ